MFFLIAAQLRPFQEQITVVENIPGGCFSLKIVTSAYYHGYLYVVVILLNEIIWQK